MQRSLFPRPHMHNPTFCKIDLPCLTSAELSQVFGKGKDALLTPDVIYAMKQGKVYPGGCSGHRNFGPSQTCSCSFHVYVHLKTS